MKLLLIITDYGSFNNFLSEVAIKLTEEGHQVEVLCSKLKVINYNDKFDFAAAGVVFHFVDFPRSFNLLKQLKASSQINKKIQEIDPSMIHIHFTTGIFTTVLWKKPPYYTIGTIHGLGYPVIESFTKRKVFEIVEKFCFSRLDRIDLINDFDYDLVRKAKGNKAFKLPTTGLGCDIIKFDPFKYSEKDNREFKHDLGLRDGDFIITYTGRFVHFKGFDKVIRTMKALVEAGYPSIYLVLIGGPDGAHSNGLSPAEDDFFQKSNRVVKVGFTAEVERYLAVTDLFFFPSEKEGMPVCIIESLAMGVPVVTIKTRGCADLVENGFNGLVLDKDASVEDFVKEILNLYNNSAMRLRMSANARSNRTYLSRNNYVDEQIKVYESLLP
jgi:glycosyltransferase involved in cell wall biosynthesis